MITRGLANMDLLIALRINSCNILVVTSKSAMTPSLSGRTATMEPGVRPITSFASCPTDFTVSVLVSTATTEGSRIIMPLPFMKISVFAVPKSMPMSRENMDVPLSVVQMRSAVGPV